MNNSEKREALHDAARLCGLDGHVKVVNYKNECITHAEQIAEAQMARPFPVKNSYLYCGTLDACFYYDREDNACCSFSGYVRYGTGDYERMGETAACIQMMLFAMRMAAKHLKGGSAGNGEDR